MILNAEYCVADDKILKKGGRESWGGGWHPVQGNTVPTRQRQVHLPPVWTAEIVDSMLPFSNVALWKVPTNVCVPCGENEFVGTVDVLDVHAYIRVTERFRAS